MYKLADKLTEAAREHIKSKNFALHEDGEEKYPIHDIEHARNALARVSQFGTPEEQEEVRRKVYEKYPELAEHKVEKEIKKVKAAAMLLEEFLNLSEAAREAVLSDPDYVTLLKVASKIIL